MNQHDIFGNRVAIPVRIPSSYESLPAPRVPSDRRFREVDSVRRSLIKKAGLIPGTYTSLDSGLFVPVAEVLDGLTDHLIGLLTKYDIVDLSMRLYTRHEELLGHVLKAKYYSIPDTLYGDASRAAMDSHALWQKVTPLTEPIRWLIEIGVKNGQSHGIRSGNAKIDYLIVLANVIYLWDASWEHVLHGIVPHEVRIDQDFTVTPRPTDRANKILSVYREALRSHLAEGDKEWADAIQQPRRNLTVDQLMDEPSHKILDAPLEQERGYSMADWFRFSAGLIDSFDPTKYCQITKVSKLSNLLSQKWDVEPDRLEHILIDHGLSSRVLDNIEMHKLRPMEYARRDSRLLRRPIVLLGSPDKPVCIYGIETVEASGRMFLDRLITGRIGLPMKSTGPLKRAIGRIQTNLGDAFRDRLADRCNASGYECVKEKKRVAHEKIPQDRGFGPVDAFVIDRKFRRFVLVETKDVADAGTVPRLIKNEFERFLHAIQKLESQINWFDDHIEALKNEFGISREAVYEVVGVIVISSPRLWMYAQTESLPVVDEYDFFRILDKGGRFQTEPVPS